MLDALIKFSLRNRFLVLALTAASIVYGWLVLQKLPIDVFPDLNKPMVNIITEATGMAPEEIELVVTRQIETVVNGTPGVTHIYSSSATGLSVVRVEFDWGANLKEARLAISERLQLAKERLPEGVHPFLSPTSSIMGEIQMIGLSSPSGAVNLSDLRSLAEWTIKPRLLTIPGVSQVTIIGGEQRQVQVLLDADKLRKRQISMEDIFNGVENLSAASGGGYVTAGDKEWLVRNIGRILKYEEIAGTAIGMHMGIPVLLGDVAKVEFAPAPKRGDASINATPGVILMVQKQPTADTLRLSAVIDAALAEMKSTIPDGVELSEALFKQANFIEAAIGNVTEALRDGTIIVAIILILFLLNFRTTIITLTAIPVSLMLTAIVFYIFDVGVNTMTLGGLAIAIGELVDDAIVDVENVFRRLRENKHSLNPRPMIQIVYTASSEIRNSIVLATIIVVLVFVPLFALSGIEGRLFTPIGIGYVVSLIASLLVSITLTPVLCYFLLGKSKFKSEKETLLVRSLKAADRAILSKVLDHPLLVIFSCAALVTIALSILPFMGRNFLPPFNEGSAMAEASVKAGISLDASSALAMKVETSLKTVPEVISTGRRTGRADEDDHAAGVNHSEWEIALKDLGRPRAEVFADLREKIKTQLPEDAFFSVSQPISHRLDHILSGVKAQVAIKLVGTDLRILRQQGAEIRNAIQGTPGVVDLQIEGQSLFPQHKIYAMRQDLAKYGIIPGELIHSLEAMLQGVPVTRIIEQDRFLDVYIRLEETFRKTIEDIKKLPVKVLPTGEVVQLDQVTDIFETSGPNMVERENLQRRIAISFNTAGRDIDSVVNDVKAKIEKQIQLPPGYYTEFGGQYESQKQAIRKVTILGILSIFGIFFVLFINFKSAVIALQIMVNIPLALVGSVAAIYFTERTFSVATLIAFVTLCGIASRNGILMISHYIHLMKEEGESFSKDMVIRGSLERLVPVLMTALAAMLALTPLLFAKDQPGKEILHPVAVVIVSGLFSSTLLDIFVTPAIFYRFGRRSAERLSARGESIDAAKI